MDGRVDLRRLTRPGGNDALAAVAPSDRGPSPRTNRSTSSPCGGLRRGRLLPCRQPDVPMPRPTPRLLRSQRQPMIGRRPGQRVATLDDVQPVHLARVRLAALGKRPRVLQRRPGARRADRRRGRRSLGLIQRDSASDRACRSASFGPLARCRRDNRLVLVPLRFGKRLEQSRAQRCQRRRTARLGQHAQALPLAFSQRDRSAIGRIRRTFPSSV